MFFLNSFDSKNDEKIFYAKDRYIEEFIILYSDDTTGIRINLFKDHNWYGQSDFKYILNRDTLRIDLVDDKIGNIVLFVRKNKLKKIFHDNSLFFNKYYRISAKKMHRINETAYSYKRNVL
jgi:hypothetical protein